MPFSPFSEFRCVFEPSIKHEQSDWWIVRSGKFLVRGCALDAARYSSIHQTVLLLMSSASSAPCPPPMQITIMDHHCVRAGEGRNLVDGIEVGRCFEMEIFNDCGQRCLEESSSGRWYESCVEKWKSELQRKRQGSRGATWNRLMLGIIWNRLMLRKKINVSYILYV